MTAVIRSTGETYVRVAIGSDGAIDTAIPFLTHMLTTLSRYSGLAIAVEARGDLRHHVIEDVAITLGSALRRFTPATAARYGNAVIPMDDALVACTIDLGGRSYYEGPLPSSLYEHFMRSLAENARATIHIRVMRGHDRHHVIEAAFKAFGMALRQAVVEGDAVFSTKGAAVVEVI